MTEQDTRLFLDTIAGLADHPDSRIRDFFDTKLPTFVSRAPGRLDVMGGIADYSGSLVMEYPIAQATHCALQMQEEPGIEVISIHEDNPDIFLDASIPLEMIENWKTADYSTACKYFAGSDHSWAAYAIGTILVLVKERGLKLDQGLRMLVHSSVPVGKGVSSSAALEVAAMKAVSAAFDMKISPYDLAALCQLAENRVVGAPCGIMDQMTSVFGKPDHLLSLKCQPAEILGFRPIPGKIRFWGIDSGIQHAVSGSDYKSVRTGAFMGYRIIAKAAGLECRSAGNGRVVIQDNIWNGYLANITLSEFTSRFERLIPEYFNGGEFLDRYQGITDSVTMIDPDRVYAVLKPTAHPIFEHHRIRAFSALIEQEMNEENLTKLGQMMYQSHISYSECGLGSDGTDELVELVRTANAKAGLYGAKITGGGSGGTVAVLGRSEAGEAIREIADEYSSRHRKSIRIFEGSSAGAEACGVLRIVRGHNRMALS